MSNKSEQKNGHNSGSPTEKNWGPGLFVLTLVLVLVFFWWVLIYSGGVTPHHG